MPPACHSCDNKKNSPALEYLWNTIHVRLCRFICSRIPDEDDAEDILQNVFLRIHTHLDTVRDMDRLEGWIYQIARNCITDYYRERRRFIPLTDIAIEDDESEAEADTTENLATDIREIVFPCQKPIAMPAADRV